MLDGLLDKHWTSLHTLIILFDIFFCGSVFDGDNVFLGLAYLDSLERACLHGLHVRFPL